MNTNCVIAILAVSLSMPAVPLVAADATGRPVGGGILDAGLRGDYFANPDLSGKPVFTRKDVRVNFDWGTLLPIIGSRAENLKNFPRDNFSARWTGRISPRFSEPYTFHLVFDDGARLFIRPEGAPQWATLVDQWDKAGDVTAKPYAMEANKAYDVKIEYRELKGPAKLLVSWSSPSAPEETLDAASLITLGGTDAEPYINADAFRCVSPWGTKDWKTADGKQSLADDQFDEDHWPKCDARANWFHQLYPGRYLLEFTGKAAVGFSAKNGRIKWVVGETSYDKSLPAGAVYAPDTNKTRAYLDIESETRAGVGAFVFIATQRDANSVTNTGIRDIRLWRPVAPGAKEHHVPGTAVSNLQRGFADQYVNIRFYRMLKHQAGKNGPATWAGRARPTMDDHMREGGCLEDYILYCNELGRDLYVNVQTGDPTAEFMKKLALALKYGTDGKEPYDRPVENPVYPPLNANLRVYFEFMNECVWNYSGIYEGIARAQAANNADWQVLNYDGQGEKRAPHRWMGLKTVQFSQAFRDVYGDAAMGDRVRVQMFGQYENSWQWFPIAQFLDDYFNNADGQQHVPVPHPVNYYVWGGGGCTYYSCSNPRGRMPGNPLANPDLETPVLKPGASVVRPADVAWTFTGDGGICDYLPTLTTAIKATGQGQPYKPTGADERVGFKFTVGPKDIYVPQVGCPAPTGKKDRRWKPRVALYEETGKQMMMEDRLNLVPDADGFSWGLMESLSASLANRPKPLRLEAGKSYYLLADPSAMGGKVAGDDTALQAAEGIRVDGAAVAKRTGKSGATDLRVVREGSFGFGPVNFRFTTQPVVTEKGAMSRPPFNMPLGRWTEDVDPGGKQCLFLRDNASATQEIEFKEAGVYAIVFWWSGPAGAAVSENYPCAAGILGYSIDGKVIEEKEFYRAPNGWNEHSSPAFRIEKPGRHVFTLTMKKGEAFFDKFKMVSELALFGGPDAPNFPQGGEAYMGTKSKDWRAKIKLMNSFPMAYGLAVTTYEGGWSIGGDAGWSPFTKYCAYQSPFATAAQQRVMDVWAELGGFQSQHHYPQTDDGHDGPNAPLVKGTIAHNRRLAPEPDAALGRVIPCELGKDDCLFALDAGGMTLPWYAWRVIAPKTGEYAVSAECTGDASVKLLLKENQALAEGKAGQKLSGEVFLTKGVHVIKLRFTGGMCDEPKLSIKP